MQHESEGVALSGACSLRNAPTTTDGVFRRFHTSYPAVPDPLFRVVSCGAPRFYHTRSRGFSAILGVDYG
ncbi:MAG: hypothetical protein JWP89_1975 [Schlesneria sp.]|nr:hypothetical protein [Schlesneria sp.]